MGKYDGFTDGEWYPEQIQALLVATNVKIANELAEANRLKRLELNYFRKALSEDTMKFIEDEA